MRPSAIDRRRLFSDPLGLLTDRNRRLDELERALVQRIVAGLIEPKSRLAQLAGRLDALSPLKVLGRGYCLATVAATGQLLRAASEVAIGADLHLQLAEGNLGVNVTAVDAADEPGASAT